MVGGHAFHETIPDGLRWRPASGLTHPIRRAIADRAGLRDPTTSPRTPTLSSCTSPRRSPDGFSGRVSQMTELRALVIGASGLVGGALLRNLGSGSIGTYRSRPRPNLRQLDATNRSAVAELIQEANPNVIFFPAANPNVDWCERDPAAAEIENLEPLRATLDAARTVPLVAYSTDYVFDGAAGPYAESDATNPLSVYGRIKLELEDLVLAAAGTVIRTVSVFGWEPPPARNFVLRLAASLSRGERARIPDDQIATPTYVEDLAAASIRIARAREGGIWHVAGEELMARDEFARMIAEVFEVDQSLIDGVPTAILGQPAARPLRSGLRTVRYHERFGTAPVRPVRTALQELRERIRSSDGRN